MRGLDLNLEIRPDGDGTVTITVHDVPEALVRALEDLAVERGQTLDDLLLSELPRWAAEPATPVP